MANYFPVEFLGIFMTFYVTYKLKIQNKITSLLFNNQAIYLPFNDEDFKFVQTELDAEIKNGQTGLQKAGIMVELSRLQLVAGILFTHKGVNLPQAAGLVFTGYGEQEYFPSLFDCKVNVVVNG